MGFMKKPKKGDILEAKDPESSSGDPNAKYFKVIQVHDTLVESWDPFGENAMAQWDHDIEMEQTGEWYAVVSFCDRFGRETETGSSMSLGSYEVVDKDDPLPRNIEMYDIERMSTEHLEILVSGILIGLGAANEDPELDARRNKIFSEFDRRMQGE